MSDDLPGSGCGETGSAATGTRVRAAEAAGLAAGFAFLTASVGFLTVALAAFTTRTLRLRTGLRWTLAARLVVARDGVDEVLGVDDRVCTGAEERTGAGAGAETAGAGSRRAGLDAGLAFDTTAGLGAALGAGAGSGLGVGGAGSGAGAVVVVDGGGSSASATGHARSAAVTAASSPIHTWESGDTAVLDPTLEPETNRLRARVKASLAAATESALEKGFPTRTLDNLTRRS